MKIDNEELDLQKHYLSPVTYVPNHVESNTGHKDCEQGIIINIVSGKVQVLYCKSRTAQITNPDNLIWG